MRYVNLRDYKDCYITRYLLKTVCTINALQIKFDLNNDIERAKNIF